MSHDSLPEESKFTPSLTRILPCLFCWSLSSTWRVHADRMASQGSGELAVL
jgi:hypothetical protein